MKSRLSRWFMLLLVLIISSLRGFGVENAEAARWDEKWFPNHEVLTHKGEKIKFYDDAIDGKIVVFNFIYTSCPDICSLSTARLAQVYERLGERVGKDIFFYSVSIDPETDTPERLREYAEAFGIDKGWLFLTGKPEEIKEIRWKLGERSRRLSEHRSDIVLGNDNTGEWQRMSLMANLSLITQRVREMDPVYRNTRRKVAVKSDKELRRRHRISPDQQGSALFIKACSSCHTVGEGDKVGPDLKGVTERRELDWLIEYMVKPDVLRARNDPIAVALDKRYKGVSMPNLRLSETDAEDVIAYIRAQEALIATGNAADGSGHDGHHGHHENGHDSHHRHDDHGSHEGHQGHGDDHGGHGEHDHGSAGDGEGGHDHHGGHEHGKQR